MKKFLYLFLILSLTSLYAQKHFITDKNYLAKVEKKFQERKEIAKARNAELFSVLGKGLTTEEAEAMKFLYAYMPLCDLADYNGDFFLKQVRYALKARETFKWGKSIPENIFRHFVLPYRVNNENLDTARVVFFEELKDRVKNLTLKEAALEVNYWCLEKVTYRGTDIRTSAPLATMRTAYGRCGEESTFTVTALRSVGIPARQVYTPRWAHSDDNHAWVEVYVDGKWQYMGACEPEADLNIGWFTEPARRAMLVHTKVFGDYPGNDEVVNKGEEYSEINVLGNYAETKKLSVKVLDKSGNPVENARVDFGLYNYAEFYPIASKLTDKKGIAYLTTGKGTLLVWASRNNIFAYEKVSVDRVQDVVLKLTGNNITMNGSMDIIPPPVKTPYPVNAKGKEKNALRVKNANAIREKYRSTFIDTVSIYKLADGHKLNRQQVLKYLKLSEGNYEAIKSFITSNTLEEKSYLFGMLAQISEKDLRDTKAAILNDHMKNAIELQTKDNAPKDIFIEYILNPRIKNENLISYRGTLREAFRHLRTLKKKDIPSVLVDWVNKNIKLNETANYYNLPISPLGVYELKVSNRESRDIFFVALCRSLGVPSRLEPKLKIPQYFDNGEWFNVYFGKQAQVQPDYGSLVFKKGNADAKIDPKYYTHFTIGKLENGIYKTIDYETEPLLSSFKEPVKLETGNYRLITGNRRADGAVFSEITHFKIEKGKQFTAVINLRNTDSEIKVLGKLNLNSKIASDGKQVQLSNFFSAEHIIIGWVEPSKEPTRHTIVELRDLRGKFDDWGGKILLIVTKENEAAQFIKDNGEGLPKNISFVKDGGHQLLNAVKKELGITADPSYPLFVVVNKKGEIFFAAQGYQIGTGEQLFRNAAN